jgi:hypothetical protein
MKKLCGYLESVGHSVRSVTLEGEVVLWVLSISVLEKNDKDYVFEGTQMSSIQRTVCF